MAGPRFTDRSKTHAAADRRRGRGRECADGSARGRSWDSRRGLRASVAQYKPEVLAHAATLRALALALWIMALAFAAPPAQAAACAGPQLVFKPAGPGVWWVPAQAGESDAGNRGQVSNLLLVRQGQGRQAGLWVLGSGPSPAFGEALACQARQRLGLPLAAVISPWARPELVLGVAGLLRVQPGLPHWAHASVADAMADQCPHCVDRLRQRLGPAAADLGDDPIRLPTRRLQGEQGQLGPFFWWRLPRAEGRWVTVWRLRRQPLWAAHGLMTAGSPPDGRDADLAMLARSLDRLAALARRDGPAARFMGEQGDLLGDDAAARQAAYWRALKAAAVAAIERGDDEAAAAPALAGWPAAWAQHPWHGFNWQRAWRQFEPEVLAAPGR